MSRIKSVLIYALIMLASASPFAGVAVYAEEKSAYLSVTGPCDLTFPKDHGAHPGYRTEWWYYTGNLKSDAGDRFGFQLTFFRRQIVPPGAEKKWPNPASAWRTRQIYLAHAAITDISGKTHLQAESISRQALGLAGTKQTDTGIDIFLYNWQARIEKSLHRLNAKTEKFSLDISLKPEKPLILHGDNGYSRKGSSVEMASCYYSFTRLSARGNLTIHDRSYRVQGQAWMDHEYSTAPLEAGATGWDWFSLQLSDQTEVMIYLLRNEEGGWNAASGGTFIHADGRSTHLSKHDLKIEVLDTWKRTRSTATAVYPSKWRLEIKPADLNIVVISNLSDQEMHTPESTGVTYWEGSVSAQGTQKGKAVSGTGYVELTGYAEPFDLLMKR